MADREEEFQEEEMWGFVMKEKEKSTAWNLPLPSEQKMMIPKAKNVGNEGKNIALQHSSVPMKIPGWSQNYNKKNSNKGVRIRGTDEDEVKDVTNNENGYIVETEDDEEEQMIPPHEYIAKKMARTRIASYSMCEGIGRTLKGRDLCKLRNAILTQTGFLEK